MNSDIGEVNAPANPLFLLEWVKFEGGKRIESRQTFNEQEHAVECRNLRLADKDSYNVRLYTYWLTGSKVAI